MTTMSGLMQHRALITGMLIDHAARAHGTTQIASRRSDGALERSDWRTVAARARRVAGGLAAPGAGQGDRIATLA